MAPLHPGATSMHRAARLLVQHSSWQHHDNGLKTVATSGAAQAREAPLLPIPIGGGCRHAAQELARVLAGSERGMATRPTNWREQNLATPARRRQTSL